MYKTIMVIEYQTKNLPSIILLILLKQILHKNLWTR